MSWAEHFINWCFDTLAGAFGDAAALVLMIVLPALVWGGLVWWKWGALLGVIAFIVIAVIMGLVLLVVGTRGING